MALLVTLGLLSVAGAAFRADQPMFPFVIPWDDASTGTAQDASILNSAPAGKNGHIVVKYGHFVEANAGKRVRFFGTNIAGPAALPGKDDADKLAGHLAKLGINIVRLHHLQHNWDENRMIWLKGKVFQELDPAQLDKLDYLIYALKRRGIYVNVNLQTTREYPVEAGLPESVNQIPFEFRKRVDKFYPKLIELQKQYAKDLLDRVNPYTHTRYADEPALAVVEINNENSLVGSPWEGFGGGLSALPEPFRGELKKQWNGWLRKRYASDESLKKAWAGGTPPGPSLIHAGSEWSFENHSNGDVTPTVSPEAPAGRTASAISVRIGSNPGPDWHVQAGIRVLDLQEGATYTLKFRAKADRDRTANVGATLDVDDWHNLGLSETFSLGSDWKSYKFVFTAERVLGNHNRITFVLGGATGTVDIADLSLSPGVPGGALGTGESLTQGNVELGDAGTARERADWIAFLAETEKAFSEGMRSFLRDGLGLKANIIDTQVAWGGLTGVYRDQNMDFADNHAYWQHPEFPGRAWDASNWRIGNTPMIDRMDKDCAELGRLAGERVWGKPYSVSEYNHPAPSDFQCEMMPLYATFAAIQNWDAIYTFDYGDTREGGKNDEIQGYFAVGTNPAKAAFFAASAMIFRAGLIPPAPEQAVLELPARPWTKFSTATAAWSQREKPDLYRTRTAVLFGPAVLESPTQGKAVAKAVRGVAGVAFLADAPAAKVLAGFVGGNRYAMGEATFEFPTFGNGFAGVVLTTNDGKPVSESGRLLLTAVGRVENQDMVWNSTRTSVGEHWGHGPTGAEGIPCNVALKTDGPRKVWALGGSGKRDHEVAASFAGGVLKFTIGPSERTLWYEITK